jgi:hypothetical protein
VRGGQLGIVTLVLVVALGWSWFEPPTAGEDLRTLPAPAEDVEAARAAVRCELTNEAVCTTVVDHLLSLPFAWHRTGYELVLLEAPPDRVPRRPDGDPPAAAAIRQLREIQLYLPWAVNVSGDDVGAYRYVLPQLDRVVAHEVGHVFHQSCGDEAALLAWAAARGFAPDVRLRGHGPDGYDSVAEDLAEAAAMWLLDDGYRSRSNLDGPPLTDADLEELAARFFFTCHEGGTPYAAADGTAAGQRRGSG